MIHRVSSYKCIPIGIVSFDRGIHIGKEKIEAEANIRGGTNVDGYGRWVPHPLDSIPIHFAMRVIVRRRLKCANKIYSR